MDEINLNAFSSAFRNWSGFNAFVQTLEGSPSLVTWINQFAAGGGVITLGDGTYYGSNQITVKTTWLPGGSQALAGGNTQLAVVLGHELGHAIFPEGHADSNLATNPTQAAQIGLTGEGTAYYAEYRVATELGTFMHSDNKRGTPESLQARFDALATQYGIGSSQFRNESVSIGAEFSRTHQPNTTSSSYNYEQYYGDVWIISVCAGLDANMVGWSSLNPSQITYTVQSDGSCRVVGDDIPYGGRIIDFNGTVSPTTGRPINVDILVNGAMDQRYLDTDSNGAWDRREYFDGGAYAYRAEDYQNGVVTAASVNTNGDAFWDRVDYFNGSAYSIRTDILTNGAVTQRLHNPNGDQYADRIEYFNGSAYAIRTDILANGAVTQRLNNPNGDQYTDQSFHNTNGDGIWDRVDHFNGGAYAAQSDYLVNGAVVMEVVNPNGDAYTDEVNYFNGSVYAYQTDVYSGGSLAKRFFNTNADNHWDKISTFNGGYYEESHYSNGAETARYINSNGDGWYDEITYFNAGSYASQQFLYQNGVMTQAFTNTNGDGIWDQIDFYNGGAHPYRIETFQNGSPTGVYLYDSSNGQFQGYGSQHYGNPWGTDHAVSADGYQWDPVDTDPYYVRPYDPSVANYF